MQGTSQLTQKQQLMQSARQRTCSQLPAGTPNSNSCDALLLLSRRMTEALAASFTAVAGNCMQDIQHKRS
jgi:hypothetical protein